MNFRQLQYAVTLSQFLSISQAAEKLNITQPALSKQILSLEKDLNVVLFDRSVSPLTLTPAGECFVQQAKEILFREKQLQLAMEDYKRGDRGKLTIGISPFRAGYFLTDVIKKLQKVYPGLQVVLKECGSTQLQKDAVESQVDFAIMNLPVDESKLDVTLLEPEPVVLAIPEDFARLLRQQKENQGQINLADCKEIPFVALGKNQELRQLFDKLCDACSFEPEVTIEVVGITTAWNLVQDGIGATVLPLRFIEGKLTGKGVRVFSIGDTAITRQPAIVRKKGQYLSKYAQTALDFIVNR